MEGLPQLCDIASNQFKKISNQEKYKIYQGLYQSTFPDLMREDINFNILFIDGHHQKTPTLQYFQDLKSKLVFPAIFIFDDINWSNDMKEAWETIKSDDKVSYSIDMFQWGIIIINGQKSKSMSHYKLHLTY
jgi:predicted O-methyltransferase YrrM